MVGLILSSQDDKIMILRTILLVAVACCGILGVDSFSPKSTIQCRATAPRRRLRNEGIGPALSAYERASFFHPSRRLVHRLFQSAAVETIGSSNATTFAAPVNTTTSNSTSTSSENIAPTTTSSKVPERPQRTYDMPWGDFQQWAMKDYLAKYTVQVHLEQDGRDTLQAFTLWRSLSNDVTALSGYPLKFLVDRYKDMREELNIKTSTEILPYLDGFAFESDGGVSGRAYGIAGVAEGTRIQTTPVAGVETTLQKGYILTKEGIVYELGLPATSETYSLDGRTKMAERAASSIQSAASDIQLADVVGNQELVKLGALTAIVISGAWAMEALSHHLTVNVFWV